MDQHQAPSAAPTSEEAECAQRADTPEAGLDTMEVAGMRHAVGSLGSLLVGSLVVVVLTVANRRPVGVDCEATGEVAAMALNPLVPLSVEDESMAPQHAVSHSARMDRGSFCPPESSLPAHGQTEEASQRARNRSQSQRAFLHEKFQHQQGLSCLCQTRGRNPLEVSCSQMAPT